MQADDILRADLAAGRADRRALPIARGPVRDRKIPELMSVAEVAELLGMTHNGVLKMIDTGRLPAARAGRAWVIRRATVEALEIPTS